MADDSSVNYPVLLRGPGIDDSLPLGTAQEVDAALKQASKQIIRTAMRGMFARNMDVLERIMTGEAVTYLEYVSRDGKTLRIPVFPKVSDQVNAFKVAAQVGGLNPRPDPDEPDDDDDSNRDSESRFLGAAQRVTARLEELAKAHAKTGRNAHGVVIPRATQSDRSGE